MLKEFFETTNQYCVVHEGKKYYHYLPIDRKGHIKLQFEIVSTNSPCEQGIAYALGKETKFKGKIFFNGVRVRKPRNKHTVVVIDKGEYDGDYFTLDFYIEEGMIRLACASDQVGDYPGILDFVCQRTGKTLDQFEHHCYISGIACKNNAFWIETVSDSVYRFHCDDHHGRATFDSLIFEMTVLELD